MSGLHMRPATETDLEPLVALYQSVRDWLTDQGTDQWSTYSKAQFRERLARSISENCCYVALDGDQLLGTITVDTFADPDFWNVHDQTEDALYVHRMIVDRKAAGKDIGGLLLDYAVNLAAAKEKRWLRLDAWRTNTKLHAYYVNRGFAMVRVISLKHRGSGALFQQLVRSTV